MVKLFHNIIILLLFYYYIIHFRHFRHIKTTKSIFLAKPKKKKTNAKNMSFLAKLFYYTITLNKKQLKE